jgi:Ig-like domain CHU_C associated
MKTKVYIIFILATLFKSVVSAQTCPAPIVPSGDLVNVVSNPGFESGVIAPGNTGPHTLLPAANSFPGTYMINGSSNLFNAGMIAGITPHSGSQMLMIDGSISSNAIAWEQTVNVTAGKLYYFSAWLTSLSAVEQSEMRFQVEPVLPVAGPPVDLGTTFIPITGPAWRQEFGTWASGATTQVRIRLINRNPDALGGLGNDYAIDDIIFRPTCVGTTAGPKPDFGSAVIGICNNGGSVNLNSNVANNVNHTYTWFRGATNVPNVSTPDILEGQTLPGTYKVCLDSAGCVNSATVVLQAALSLDLGPDLDLCNPAFKLLDTRITAPGSFTIRWYKNSTLIPSATGTSYMATGAGLYRVDVTDGASCSGTDQITITSQVDETVSATFCPPATTATVSVVNAGGTYNWYNVATGGSSIGGGLTYNATGLVAAGSPYTFYVENSKPVVSGGGLLNNASPFLGPGAPPYGGNNVHGQNQMIFSANVNSTITSITVTLDMNANYAGNVTITLEDRTVPSTLTSTSPISNNPGAAGVRSYPIPLALALTAGHTYWLSIVGVNGSSFTHRYTGANIPTYFPANYTAVNMISGQVNSIYPGLFDWKFASPTTCARTPATITDICSLPVTLIDFTANYIGSKTVALQWSTANEENNDYFTLQRSVDGIHFTDLAEIDGAGTTNTLNNYRHIDAQALAGLSYYRLKQTDFDGHYTFSDIAKVDDRSLQNFSLTLSPNPTTSGSSIFLDVFGAGTQAKIPIAIYDMLGRLLYSSVLISDESGSVHEDLSRFINLQAGTYIISVTPAHQIEYKQKMLIY